MIGVLLVVGNKWYKCDLHIHSTASQCFQDKKVTAKEWVEECLNKGLDCVALTDHNTGENIDEYKRVASENGLVFFPGVELTCGENGTHLLVLFDLSAGTNEISDFLTEMGIKREDWATAEACSMKSVLEVIDFAEREGLLVIPAHIDEFNGISSAKFGNLKKIFEAESIHAVQAVQKEFFENRSEMIARSERDAIYESVNARYHNRVGNDTLESWYKSVVEAEKTNMTFLTFSDNPHSKGNSKHGLWGIGTRYSYIKMKDKPNLGSLRDALMLGETRVHSDFSNFSINENEVLLEKLSFSGTTLSKKEVVVEFSDNLTTIIGGRGTGKSCITRFLVYVLGKETELDQFSEIQRDYQNFAQVEQNGSGIFLHDTVVKLNVTYKGTKYQIIRTQNKHTIYEFTPERSLVEKGTERLRMISNKVNIYSQKQIYEISKNQTSILELLDGYNAGLISQYKNEIETCVTEIKKINWDIVTVKNEIQDKAKVELEIEDLKKQVEKLSHKSYKDVYDEYLKETEVFRELKRDVESLKKIPQNLTDSLDKIDFGSGIKVTDEIDKSREELISKLLINQAKIQTIIGEMSDEIDSYRAGLNESGWKVNYTELSQRYQKLSEELSQDELEMLQNLDSLYQSLSKTEDRLQEINQKERKLKDYQAEVDSVMSKMNQAYQNLYSERSSSSQEIFSDITGIEATIQPNRDFINYVKEFRTCINKEETFDSEFVSLIGKLSNNSITDQDIYKDILNIRANGESKIFSDKKLINSIKKLNDAQVFELQTLKPNDLVVIRLELNGKKVSLSNASAGQKTSAILSMILAYGNSPLILDQPEDDLDSQLINNLIVRSIITKKENRQILIVTHNANIPVNGDSEWLISMGDSKEISADQCGSVDEPNIKARICTVMEGGADAFTNRAKRYGFKQIVE